MIYKKYWLKSNTCRISLTYILLLFQIVKPDFVNHDIMLSLNISNFIKMHVSYRSRLSNILSPPALDDFFQNPISWGVSLLPSSVVPNVFGLNMKHLARTWFCQKEQNIWSLQSLWDQSCIYSEDLVYIVLE